MFTLIIHVQKAPTSAAIHEPQTVCYYVAYAHASNPAHTLYLVREPALHPRKRHHLPP